MSKIIFFVLLAFCFLASGCSNKFQQFKWMEGTWEMRKSNSRSRLEVWKREDKDRFSGSGLKVTGMDTILLEDILLLHDQDSKTISYITTVPDQNQGLPVQFKMVSHRSSHFTFENPEHDFPQRIIYQFKPLNGEKESKPSLGDTLSVRVEYLIGKGIQFSFLRK